MWWFADGEAVLWLYYGYSSSHENRRFSFTNIDKLFLVSRSKQLRLQKSIRTHTKHLTDSYHIQSLQQNIHSTLFFSRSINKFHPHLSASGAVKNDVNFPVWQEKLFDPFSCREREKKRTSWNSTETFHYPQKNSKRVTLRVVEKVALTGAATFADLGYMFRQRPARSNQGPTPLRRARFTFPPTHHFARVWGKTLPGINWLKIVLC